MLCMGLTVSTEEEIYGCKGYGEIRILFYGLDCCGYCRSYGYGSAFEVGVG